MPTETTSFRSRIETLLRIDPEQKPRVYANIFDAAEIANLNYWLELLFSAGIATLGLVLNSPAVVIGAMLISPLMGPILAAGLALAAADLYLGIKSLLNIAASVAGAVLVSAVLVWLLPFHAATAEILARTQPNLLDLGVALFSGLAGSVVVCRMGNAGGVTALPGVAIAVALMPPLCTVGFGVGSGFSGPIIYGAGLLFLTNLAAIIASAFVIFYIVRMDSLDVRMKIDYTLLERISRDKLYNLLGKTWLSRGVADIGRLQWRILMLVFVLAFLFVPLRKSLLQLRDETVARAAARDVMRELAQRDSVLSQQVDFSADRIAVRMVVTTPVSAEKVRQAERTLLRRTGKEATVAVRKVASDEELAFLRERLTRPAPPPPQPQDLNLLQRELIARVEAPLKEIWPSDAAPLLGYELGFTTEEVLVRVRYQSEKPLDTAVESMLHKSLAARLGAQKFRVVLEQEKPAPPPKRTSLVRRK